MCHRGCECSPCFAQRQIDRKRAKARKGSPDDYPSQASIYRRASKYGLTEEALEEMQRQRDNLCDICGRPETVLGSTGRVKSLAVDHCHETGRIRGLLCNNCNRALGLYGHNVAMIERVLAYLRATD